ncbi:MAG: hypothetical protein IT368_03235 [Candidatus Hydrogenedentes bacterium]|nr:hypothetical protein [Candidatus Hydrogenedentota bacterium]
MCLGTILLGLLITTCARTSETIVPNDSQAEVRAALSTIKAGLQAQNLDAVLAGYSESFDHPEYRDKAAVREFLRQAYMLGYLNGLNVDDSQAEVRVDGPRAEVYPVRISAAFGTLVLKLTLIEEPSGWKISWLDAEPA